DDTMPYRLLMPDNYDPAEKYPLVLCLHGAGGRGSDNRSRGTEAFKALSDRKVREEYPAFLLTPQCPKGERWVDVKGKEGSYSIDEVPMTRPMELVVEILDSVMEEFSVDPNRVYVTGQSMGGHGTWDLVLRHPDRFAAAIPVCGVGDPGEADRIADLPVWAFHGAEDPTVPPSGSRDMIEAIKEAGGDPQYTEYPDVKHFSWKPAWKEDEIVPWLFKQEREGEE
ncbi:MAG: prolyl oligopeptidase family serine peptidase, partial [Planctomycetota bacterium]